MKTFVLWMSLSTSAALVAVACGDSDGDGGGRGGSSGSSGASGTSGAGGSTGGSSGAATGGSAGASTGGSGGTPSGGTAGTAGGDAGGEGGVGAEGGIGGGDAGDGPGPGAGCPTAQPTPMTMCPSRGLSCDFGDTVCRCARANGNWQCFDENPSCPAMPDDGAECTGTMTACSYGEDGTCVCQNPAGPPPTPEWVCDAGLVTCPATAPMNGSSCTDFPANFACGDCTCGIGMARTWDCGGGTDMCPAMAPDSMDPCPAPGLICQYTTPGPAADPTCVCNLDSQWTCL